MRRAIDETTIEGVQTNLGYLALVLSHPRFEAGDIDVDFVERHLADMQSPDGSGLGERGGPLADARAHRRRRTRAVGADLSEGPLPRSTAGRALAFRPCTRWTSGTISPSQVLERLAQGSGSVGIALSSEDPP